MEQIQAAASLSVFDIDTYQTTKHMHLNYERKKMLFSYLAVFDIKVQ